jgi:hypothetical protein
MKRIQRPFARELAKAMGLQAGEPLPEPPENGQTLHHSDGSIIIRFDWAKKPTCEENLATIARLFETLRSGSREFNEAVTQLGSEQAFQACLTTVEGLYVKHKNQGMRKEAKEEIARRKRRTARRQRKIRRRKKVLFEDSMLQERYSNLYSAIHEIVSEEETEEEGEKTGQRSSGMLKIPPWRSGAVEEASRFVEQRYEDSQQRRFKRIFNHPGYVLWPAASERPSQLSPKIQRWMVNQQFAEQFPDAVKLVSLNRLTNDRSVVRSETEWGSDPASLKLHTNVKPPPDANVVTGPST